MKDKEEKPAEAAKAAEKAESEETAKAVQEAEPVETAESVEEAESAATAAETEMQVSGKKKSFRRKFWLAVCAVCVVVAAACIVYAISYYLELKNAQDSFDDLKAQATATESPETEDPEETESASAVSSVEIPIDFEALQEENEEIYAWIIIPGTLVDYPVLQSATDDAYYLTHGVDGTTSSSGCIYSEMQNAKDFTDPNTVLYGHNMKNDSMFGSLHDYQDRTFFDEYQYVYIYTPTQKLTYQIFAAYKTDNAHLLNTVDTHNEDAFQTYLDGVLSQRSMNANINEEILVDASDCILTLSTCIGNHDYRYVVQAVLISREE